MKTTALKSFLFLVSFLFSVCIISVDKHAVATNLAEANIMALSADFEPGILCRGQLFKNCVSKRDNTCTFQISPSASCTFSDYSNKGANPN